MHQQEMEEIKQSLEETRKSMNKTPQCQEKLTWFFGETTQNNAKHAPRKPGQTSSNKTEHWRNKNEKRKKQGKSDRT